VFLFKLHIEVDVQFAVLRTANIACAKLGKKHVAKQVVFQTDALDKQSSQAESTVSNCYVKNHIIRWNRALVCQADSTTMRQIRNSFTHQLSEIVPGAEHGPVGRNDYDAQFRLPDPA